MADCPQPTPTPITPEVEIAMEDEETEKKVHDDEAPYKRIENEDEHDHVGRHFQQAQLKRKFTNTFSSTSSVFGQQDDQVNVEMTHPVEEEGIPPPSYPILLTWQDICYGIQVVDEEEKARRGKCSLRTPMKRRALLSKVSGEARPGEMVVILGPSGCGKTTLMNILSGRISLKKNTENSGMIFVNGVKRNKRFKRHTAFVLQEDLFFPSLTVRQTLTLTGQLILRCDTEEEKQARIQSMISLLRLEKCQKGRVGNAIRRGLSGGEKKRLNIANELLIDPSLIFLDEPTSGLDAFLAEELLSILSLLAKSGRTIVTTLHQPSSQIYKLVDKVFLMAEGGRVAYFGPASQAVEHFSRLNYRCPRFYNPADFLLDLVQHYPSIHESFQQEVFILSCDSSSSSSSPPSLNTFDGNGKKRDGEVEQSTSSSSLSRDGSERPLVREKERQREREGDGEEGESVTPKILSVPGTSRPVPPPLPDRGDKWPIGWSRQAYLLAIRSLRQHADVAAWNVFIFLLIATIGAIVWWDRGYTYKAVGDRMGLMFFCLLQWFLFPMFGEVHSLVPEILVITKERREGMYRLSAYAFGKTAGEFVLDAITPLLFTTVIYWTTNLNNSADRYFTAIAIIFSAYLCGQSIGFAVGAWTGSVEFSSPILLIILFITMLVSGFYASIDGIPSFFAWLQYVSPLRYLFDAFIINEFATNQVFTSTSNVTDSILTNGTKTGYDIVNAYEPVIWNGSWVCVWYNLLVIVGMVFLFRFIGFGLLKRRTGTAF